MATREASCSCGQLIAVAEGDPVRVSVCHCLACQRRTGSAFGVQARWLRENVTTSGESREHERISDAGAKRRFHFCPSCGAIVFFGDPDEPELIAIPVGAFADPSFPAPAISVWEQRSHGWFELTSVTERYD